LIGFFRRAKIEALDGKRKSATDDEPMILRSPELYNTYVNICQAIGKEPADMDAIRRQYEEDRALGRPRFWRSAAYLGRDTEPD
jgi:hypothetical protein